APELDHLGAVPVAVPVALRLEPGHLHDLVAIVARAMDRVFRGAVAEGERRGGGDLGGEHVLTQPGGVPGDVDYTGHQAPTSARIAPGPSAVLPWPSSVAPTRIAILPRCRLSRSSWCASATFSKPIVCHSTGRTLDSSMSWLALVASHALAKCE